MEEKQTLSDNQKPRRFSIGSALCTAVLVLSLVLCASVLAQVLTRGYVTLGGYSLFRVVSGSMEPTISTGALLVSQQVKPADVAVQDIVCYRASDPDLPDRIITHRVIGKSFDGGAYIFTTQGDANTAADAQAVSGSDLVGRVVWYSQDGSFGASFLSLLSSRPFFLLCVLIPVLIICSFIMRDCVGIMRAQIAELDRLASAEKAPPAENTMQALREQLGEETYQQLRQELQSELRKELHRNDDEMAKR